MHTSKGSSALPLHFKQSLPQKLAASQCRNKWEIHSTSFRHIIQVFGDKDLCGQCTCKLSKSINLLCTIALTSLRTFAFPMKLETGKREAFSKVNGKYIGMPVKMLFSKVSLPPLDRSFNFQSASLFWNLPVIQAHIDFYSEDAPRGSP